MNSHLIKILALESGFQESEISIFLELLNATGDLKNLIVVLKNLEKVIESSEQINLFLNSINAHYFPHVAFINTMKSTLLKNISSLEEVSSKAFSRHGLQNTNPEYAMLLMGDDHPLFENKKFRMLQGVLLYCSFEQRYRLKTEIIRSIKFEIQSACRYLRQLELGINSDLDELVLPKDDWDLLEFYETNLALNVSENFKKYFSSLLLKVHHYRGGKSRAGNKKIIEKSGHLKIRYKDSTDDHQGPEVVEIFNEIPNNLENIDLERSEGAHPSEFSVTIGTKTVYSETDPMRGFSIKQHYKRQRSQVEHIASNNQLLPFRYGDLTDFELSVLGQEINSLEKKDELLSLICKFCIFFGKTANQATNIRTYSSIDNSFAFKNDSIYYSSEDKVFWIKIPEPEWKTKHSSSSKRFMFENFDGIERSKSQRLQVDLPVCLKKQLDSINISKWSFKKIKDIEERYLQFLKAINRKYGIRLTQQRIADLLFYKILKQTSDLVPAYLLSARKHTTAEVGSHYCSFDGYKLSNIFFDAVCDLSDSLRLNDEKTAKKEHYQTDRLLFGSHLYFKEKHLFALQEHLTLELKKTLNFADVRDKHNSLVLYLIFWLKFTIGLRAVNDLLFSENLFDWSTGLVVIADKETGTGHARVAWLTPKLREQLRVYQEHLKQVLAKFSRSINLPDTYAFLFFINDKGRYQAITPSRIIDFFLVWKLKDNINRHYIRTRLSDLGCPGETIDGYMGHWELGQSPYNKHSSVSPLAFIQQVKSFIHKIEEEAGWEVIDVYKH